MNCVLDLLWCWIEKRKRRQQMREVSHCVWLLQWVIFCRKPNSNLNRSNKKNLHLPISCLNNVIEESGGNLNFEFFSEKLCLDMKPSWYQRPIPPLLRRWVNCPPASLSLWRLLESHVESKLVTTWAAWKTCQVHPAVVVSEQDGVTVQERLVTRTHPRTSPTDRYNHYH